MSYIFHEPDHNCCDGSCNQGRDCPLHRASHRSPARSVAEFPYAPGRMGSNDYEDAADPPLGWRGRLVLIGLLGISAAVAISGAWLLLDWFRHLAGG